MRNHLDYTRTEQKLLELKNLSLSYGNNLILRDVNATITNITRPDAVEGQVITFLGPSGMGKSQMSKIIAGLITTDGNVKGGQHLTGDVLLDTDVPTRKGLVGMVPQDYPLFKMSVTENLFIAGKQGGLTKSQITDRMSKFVEMMGLGNYLHMYPKELSGGTRQRVAIARQMMCAEHFLIMDEPFSGQDPLMKHAASDLITQLATGDELNTILLVTHDVSEGLAVADRALMLGQEKDAAGNWLDGARFVEDYDLAKMDLAWHPDIQSDTDFQALVGDVKARFRTLKKVA